MAASIAGVRLSESTVDEETQAHLAHRIPQLDPQRIRLIGGRATSELATAASGLNIHIADGTVTSVGRLELQHYVREQAISETLHRFGNLTMQRVRSAG
jgi:RHH-type proline utilization regulon transcriptional repressor/proline dehydrogenase/delta 1-pyrroline-5-carboxylate dehydrogenase